MGNTLSHNYYFVAQRVVEAFFLGIEYKNSI
jgi:hypothetical protein